MLPVVSVLTIADGLIGFAFHLRGIHRKPGGWRTPIFDLIMGPPVLAPPLFAISGYLGLLASLLRPEEDKQGTVLPHLVPGASRPRSRWLRALPDPVADDALALEQHVREGRFQQQLAVAAAVSALFSGVEALYSHYKNNFNYWQQWTPIVLAPLLAGAGFSAIWSRTVARTVLPIVSLLALLDGLVGLFYHVRGMLRRPGGLAYPLYNLMYGPPMFAPLLFSASGFMGLLASLLRRASG